MDDEPTSVGRDRGLLLHAGTAPALGLATGLPAVVTAGALLAARRAGPWRAG